MRVLHVQVRRRLGGRSEAPLGLKAESYMYSGRTQLCPDSPCASTVPLVQHSNPSRNLSQSLSEERDMVPGAAPFF